MSLPFMPKYLFSASLLAFSNSKVRLVFSLFMNFAMFFITCSLSYPTEIIRSNIAVSSGFISTVFFNAIIGSVV